MIYNNQNNRTNLHKHTHDWLLNCGTGDNGVYSVKSYSGYMFLR